MDKRQLVLEDRAVLRITGEDATKLLDGILTCDLAKVDATTARHGALLSPQGKVLFDFLIIALPKEPGYYLDTPRATATDLAKRLGFYKLRAKAAIENLGETHQVSAFWGGASAPAGSTVFADPRLPALGFRAIGLRLEAPPGSAEAYRAHRIALGVPDIHEDFGYGDVFPHEMLMDELHGVDFGKGCYIGQEVVSRMQHRGTARTRVLQVTGDALPAKGSEISAGGKSLGTLGSAQGGAGVALIRIDRASEAITAGLPITAGESKLSLQKPGYAAFAFPLGRTADAP